MKAYTAKGGEDTPTVNFNPVDNKFEISGRSLMESVGEFYYPLLDWIEKYVEVPNEETVVDVKMEYYNTASSKMLLDVLFAFEKIVNTGKSVKIRWHYFEEDDDMKEAGEECEEFVDVPFELIPFS